MYSVEDIKSDFHDRKISKEETIKRLVSAVESIEGIDFYTECSENLNEQFKNLTMWDIIDLQVEIIKTFKKLNLKDVRVYKLLEDLILSESIVPIKAIAIHEIVELFSDKCKELMEYIIENDVWFKEGQTNDKLEPDGFRLSAMGYDILVWTENINLRKIREKIEERLNSKVQRYISEEVDPLEAKILTIFELQYGTKLIKIITDNFKRHEDYFHYKVNKEGHITSIFIKFGNPNSFIPKRIDLLKNLENLVLINGGILRIPKSIQKLEKLTILDLGNNSIKDNPKTINLPDSLEELYLWMNQLKSIPESILNLKNLKILNLSSNEIEILPETIKNVRNLIKLNLAENKISQIPESLKELKSATIIDLMANPARELPSYFNSAEWRSKIKISPPPIDPLVLLVEYASKLRLDAETEASARKTLNWYITKTKLREENPNGMVAGTLYYICNINNYKINDKVVTIKDIADLLQVAVNSFIPTYEELITLQSATASTNYV